MLDGDEKGTSGKEGGSAKGGGGTRVVCEDDQVGLWGGRFLDCVADSCGGFRL